MNKYLLYMFLVLCTIQQFYSQESNGIVALALPVRNSLKFNRYAVHPTFSFVREQNKYISFTNKRQWAQFNDAPEAYLFSYTGRFSENIGAGLGVFQQNFGVLTTFGGMANFAYNVSFSRENNLTFGLNIGAYQSGLNQGRVVVNTPDPSLQNVPSNFLLSINPGINYGTTFFDLGVSINNLVSYNVTNNQIIEDNPEQALQAHVMYTGYMDSRGFFDESKFTTLIRSEFKKDQTVISGVAMVNVPKGIWAQVGYNSLYGASAGLGVNVTNTIAVEYNYEQSISHFSEFGSSHEITLAYRFNKNRSYNYGDEDEEQSVFNTNKRRVKRNNLTDDDRARIAERRAELATKRKAEAEKEEKVISEISTQKNEIESVKKELKQDKAPKLEIGNVDKQTEITAEEAREREEERLKLEAEEKAKIEEAKIAELKAIKKAKEEEEKQKAIQLEIAKEQKRIAAQAKEEAREKEEKRIKLEAEEKAKIEEAKIAALKAIKKAKEEKETQKAIQLKIVEEQKRISAQTKIKIEEAARKKEEEKRLKFEAELKVKKAGDKAEIEKQQAAEDERLRLVAKAEAEKKLELELENKLTEAQNRKEVEALKKEALTNVKQVNTNDNLEVENEAENEVGEEEPVADDEASNAMRTLLSATNSAKKAQNELIKRLSTKVDVKQKDLDDLKEENDLSEQGIYLAPKPFKSLSAENAEIENLKNEIEKAEKEQEIKMIQLEAILIKRKRKFKKDKKGINAFYFNALEELKTDQLKIKSGKENLISNLKGIKTATDFERKRRIRRAAYDNQQDRYNKDKAALERIRKFTDKVTTPLKEEDFDFGEEQTKNIQIIKNVINEESGYYMVIAVHNSVEKRDEFVSKVIASGERDVNFFFDVKTNKYFIYSKMFDSISQAKNALDKKGDKPYNSKMSLIKINN
ncbi:PorP/SprF family type IX secretion system membrane protein [Hyunsoonleella sp. 2307UL5-6]|uniref:PorP/SprF family type IX secretion system membrane protein n=1 Tax=Hyunsoonleella sp. 2307UL5-6 TaxID=3384768 RepID=UPI0039BD8A5E